MTTTTESHRVALSALDALSRQDLDAFLAYVDPAVEVHEPPFLPYGGTHRGHEAFAALLAAAGAVLDLASLTVLAVTSDEERAVLLFAADVRATGERRHVTEHWLVRDGLIHDVRVFWFDVP